MDLQDDFRVDAGLHELLGGERPPDLSAAIRSRIARGDRVVMPPPPRARSWSALWTAAILLLGVAIVATFVVLDHTDPAGGVPAGGVPADRRAIVRSLAELRALSDDTRALTVSGIDAADLGELVRFRELADLELQIECDDAELAVLRGFSKLRRLALPSNTAIDGRFAAALEALPLLEQLDLSGTGVDADGLRSVAMLGALWSLRLEYCQRIDDPAMEVLATMHGLRALDVSWCHGVSRTGFARLATLTGLHELRIAHNDSGARSSVLPLPGDADGIGVDDGVLRALGNLTELRTLSLDRCFSLTPASMDVLARLERLEELDLTATGLAPEAIEHATAGLRTLRLEMADVDDALLARIAARFRQLEVIDISYCDGVTTKGLRQLANLPRLRHLALRDRKSATDFAPALSRLAQLAILDLDRVHGLTGDDLEALAGLPALTELRIAATGDLDDAALARLAESRTLSVLRIGGPNRITVEGLRALHGLRLAVLDLRRRSGMNAYLDPAKVRHLADEQWPGCRVWLPNGAVHDVLP